MSHHQTYHAIGWERERRRMGGDTERVRTRDRGRPAGQERRSLNAVPASAVGEVAAAIRRPRAEETRRFSKEAERMLCCLLCSDLQPGKAKSNAQYLTVRLKIRRIKK
jgi:hypothetical protein